METQPLLPSENLTKRKKCACYLVFLTVVCERIAFYAVVGNLIVFLSRQPLNWSSGNASTVLLLYAGFAFFTSIFGGWIADSFFGKFKTILFAFILYICCYIFLPLLYPHPSRINIMHNEDYPSVSPVCIGLSSNISELKNSSKTGNDNDRPLKDEICSYFVLFPLCIMAVGIGAIKANIAPFGADQIRGEGPSASRFFFNWFYWCINIGAFIGIGVLAYVQQLVNMFWGFVIPCFTLILGFLVFIFGFKLYAKKPPSGSVLSTMLQILAESCLRRKWRVYHTTLDSSTENPSLTSQDDINPSCLDRAKKKYGGRFDDQLVDDVTRLGKIILLFLTMIPYWIVYYQMQTTFLVQGLNMNIHLGDCNVSANSSIINQLYTVPSATLQVFDMLAILILVPIFDRIIYPCLDRCGLSMSLKMRIVIGMVISALAMVVAGVVEYFRRQISLYSTCTQSIDNYMYYPANMSVLWQIPQYMLIGVGEVFASITGLEMAYVEAPKSMQGIVLGVFWSINGIASFLGIVIINIFKGTWFIYTDKSGINCESCHLDYYFFMLAGLQVFGIVVFSVSAKLLKMGVRDPYLSVLHSRTNKTGRRDN